VKKLVPLNTLAVNGKPQADYPKHLVDFFHKLIFEVPDNIYTNSLQEFYGKQFVHQSDYNQWVSSI
jgi:hypothetical protein